MRKLFSSRHALRIKDFARDLECNFVMSIPGDTGFRVTVFVQQQHLCLGNLRSNSANQRLDRIINFFSADRHKQLLMDLSSKLRAIISQNR